MKKIKSIIAILFLLSSLCFVVKNIPRIYSRHLVLYFFPYQYVSVSKGDHVQMMVSTRGQDTHRHVVLEDQLTDPATSDTSFDRPDEYSFIAPSTSTVYHFVYIVSAPELVFVSMKTYVNGKKRTQSFEVVGQSDQPYKFFEINSTVNCALKVLALGLRYFSFLKNNSDPFSTTLYIFRGGPWPYSYTKGKNLYVRVNQSIPTSFKSRIQVQLQSLTDGVECQGPCMTTSLIESRFPGTLDHCSCSGIYIPSLGKCSDCITDTYPQCFPPAVCGNGIKETGQECDNRNQTGCIDCKIAAGYFCTQDQNKFSTCAQNRCGDSKKGTNEECDNGNSTGCIDCKVSYGYQCSRVYGEKSTCTGKCGDGIKLQNQDCDTGLEKGCTNCRIDPGFTCVHNLYSKSLCQAICGDGVRAVTEQCDNKNQTGCFNCKTVPGYKCSGAVGALSSCSISCGDGVFGGTEQCDNGNQAGCSANCVPDKGYVCKNELGASSDCSTVCGDGIRAGSEACDNGKKTGCLTCTQFDDGFTCTGAIGQRSNCKSVCGDSKRQANEQCDNGNAAGCSKNCLIDLGFSCTGAIGEKSTCSATCGDSIKTSTEQCDNGKKAGCSSCTIEAGYTCKLASNMKTSICTKA